MADKTTTLLTGLRFGEGPRHGPDGRFYLSDFYAHEVLTVDLATGRRERICEVAGQPSGLGWLPDGRLLIVSMLDRRVLRREPDGSLVEHADLSGIATFHSNDMLVDPVGRAYVGNFGFDLHAAIDEFGIAGLADGSVEPVPAKLALVSPRGEVSAAGPELAFPNGMVLIGTTLVIAETLAFGLTAFDVAADGSLSNRRVWADLQPHGIAPDGICADADGAIWTSSVLGTGAFRVTEGGSITDEVSTAQTCFAVALSGPRRRTLVCVTAPSSQPRTVANERLGALEITEVAVPGR
ncbi:MAG TPA: SMP-30/gluconolactonase/LRE family protein [Pseudonocardiaceae bacterium]|jgi:sugar lactone lactonase YvrE|nr:SMP-30/gluconolactonase/LRE family protein [Pseudonocardiaceae bacterium]